MKNDQHNQQALFEMDRPETRDSGPVTCLGMTFPNDEERRRHFLGILREKLKDPEFRKIEGFPIGSDEDILALSDPPYYTACPNPWIADFIREWEAQKPTQPDGNPYHREPFAADVSEGKNDPIYNAHSYHTKVPHKAIMRYILHYTEPGDIVFDGFCGTGMTGVAAQMCGDKAVVESLGYKVDKDGIIYQQEMDENGKEVWKPFSKLGARRAILNDLSPAATFIAYNYNTPVDVQAFEREAKRILKEVEDECGWMYETLHVEPASSRLISTLPFEPCNPFESSHVIFRQDNLPHVQVPGATYFVTFRTSNFRILSPEARTIALNAIRYWDNQRWKLFSAVVMPDHVHIIAKPLPKKENQYWDLVEILHSIKSFSANEINKQEAKTGVPVWQSESYDRVVRDAQELVHELAYLNHNPVKAGLVKKAEHYEWRFVAEELEKAGWKPAPLGKINYMVWSDVFVCPDCTREVIFWEAAVDKEAGSVKDEFPCPHCGALLTKRNMERAWVTKFDKAINQTIRQAKQVPVLINYSLVKPASVEPASSRLISNSTSSRSSRFEKTPDAADLALIEKIENSDIPYLFPKDRMMEGGETRRNDPIGITHVHHFYTKRNLWVLGALWNALPQHEPLWKTVFTSITQGLSKQQRFRPHTTFPNMIMSGTLYIGSIIREWNACKWFNGKIEGFKRGRLKLQGCKNYFLLTCNDATSIKTASNSLDYIFLDPPFGANLNYSELNFLWESWLKVWTNNKPEAIENKVQGKGPNEYRQLMTACFKEAYRVLKPGRWMTVEFSNTKASVWNSIQTALAEAGFIVANVSALDKQQGSFKAVTTPTAVKQDLVISAYKPNGGFEERFEALNNNSRLEAGSTISRQDAGSTEAVWDFVRTHLRYLPVVKVEPASSRLISNSASSRLISNSASSRLISDSASSRLISNSSSQPSGVSSRLLPIPERDPRILYDQMVAYYVRKGYPVPLNSAEFQEGLSQRFSYRDGMYFLPDQAVEYDRKKMTFGAPEQLSMFVTDEASAIQWLRQLIKDKPQTFQELHPQFLKEIGGWSKNEKPLELSELLEQNFLCYDGKGPIPAQIVSWLKRSEEMRTIINNELESGQATYENGQLTTSNLQLIIRSKDRWYVPDPNKAGDLEKLRERALLKEFQAYVELASSQHSRKLKVFRLEAVRAGFKKAWQERDYATIVAVANSIPNNILEEDPKLLMWYDQAVTRMGTQGEK